MNDPEKLREQRDFYKKALQRILDIANTSGETQDNRAKGMADVAFEALSMHEYNPDWE